MQHKILVRPLLRRLPPRLLMETNRSPAFNLPPHQEAPIPILEQIPLWFEES